jgi:hypothetical protein
MRSPLWPDPEEHGGKTDTSILLAIAPARVKPEYANLPDRALEGGRWSRMRQRMRWRLGGYWGAPSRASAELGQQILDERVSDLLPKLRAVWSGSNPERIFRSWYSVIPPNGSFFKAWVLALLICVLLSAWVVMIFKYSIG